VSLRDCWSLLGGSVRACGLWRCRRFRVGRFGRCGVGSRLIRRLFRCGRGGSGLFVGSIGSRGRRTLRPCRETCATPEPAQQAQREHPPPLETQWNHLRIFRAETASSRACRYFRTVYRRGRCEKQPSGAGARFSFPDLVARLKAGPFPKPIFDILTCGSWRP
jgi:hypothetical protein